MPIYLDHAAATPLDPRVFAAMQPYWQDQFYNPSGSYLAARRVKAAVEEARARVAHWLGARTGEVVFTAGATESINAAIHGVMRQFSEGNVVTLPVEHEAVLATARLYSHKLARVQPNGSVDMTSLQAAIDDQTVLLSIGYANSEIGTIQPLIEITRYAAGVRIERRKQGNPLPLYVHTDASQAAGYLDLHTARLGVDLLTINGSKIYGPKQTGALFIKGGTQLRPFITGGGQELGIRSGTENVPGVIGLSVAFDLAQNERKAAATHQSDLRDELQRRLQTAFPAMTINGNRKKRLPNNLHVSWPGIDGERLVMQLDEHGVQAATGSACAANKQTASHVLRAIGLEERLLRGSLRLTLGAATTEGDIVKAAEIIIADVSSLIS